MRQIKEIKEQIREESEKISLLPNAKKTSMLVVLLSFVIVLAAFSLPIAILVSLFMQFSSLTRMFYVCILLVGIFSYAIFVLTDVLYYYIMKFCFKQTYQNKEEKIELNISIKDVFVCDLLSPFNIVCALSLALAMWFVMTQIF